MGQITNPIVLGISVLPTDRQSGPLAGGGATGNDSIFLGQSAGQNSTISNFIAIGHHAADGGITDANLSGTTVLGANSLQALTTSDGNAVPLTVLGSNNYNSNTRADSSVIVGSLILNASSLNVGLSQSVAVGTNILNVINGNGGQLLNNVIIGANIGNSATSGGGIVSSVVIGANMFATQAGNLQVTNSVIIGNSVCPGAAAPTATVCIGQGSNVGSSSSGNVVIGFNASAASALLADNDNVVVGSSAAA